MNTTQAVAKSSLLERVIATLDVFPLSRAEVIKTVMSLTSNLDAGINELADAISTDPALTGKILRLSNSPFYGRVRKVGSLDQAIMTLGFQTIRSLVVATSTAAMFKSDKDRGLQTELWRHSLAVAVAARLIAEQHDASLREEAFITGLMHDIGKPVLLQRFTDEYKPVIEAIHGGAQPQLETEREMLGFTHADLGGHILDHWNFPPDLMRAAALHHDYDGRVMTEGDPKIEPKEIALSRIVCLANELAKCNGYTFVDLPSRDLTSLTATKSLGFDEDTLEPLNEALDSSFAETEELFSVAD